MARPRKQGLDYFPFDVDFFSDEKTVCIAGEFGLKGEITMIKLLCAVYRNGYFIEWNDMVRMKLLHSLPGVSAELLDQIVARLVRWGFFCRSLFDTAKVLTSEGIQRRYFDAAKFRIKDDELPYLLIGNPPDYGKKAVSQEKTTVSQGITGVSHWEMPQNKKKRKENISVGVVADAPACEGIVPGIDIIAEFFKPENAGSLEQLCMSLHTDLDTLRTDALEVIAEWRLRGEHHSDYKTASMHLINHLRKKANGRRDGTQLPSGTLSERKKAFHRSIVEVMQSTMDVNGNPVYDPDMCTNFFNYWTELTVDGSRMRFESERHWGTAKRMESWKSRMS